MSVPSDSKYPRELSGCYKSCLLNATFTCSVTGESTETMGTVKNYLNELSEHNTFNMFRFAFINYTYAAHTHRTWR